MPRADVADLGPELPDLRCVGLIGTGGYADVYLYERRDQPRIRVAVKLMKSGVLDAGKRRQFVAEADTMAEFAEHPFIVPVLGAGTADDGRPYLQMRYYPSSDLAGRVAKNPMTVPEALRYGVQLSSAVETAHRAGIIHRDIKPSNILISTYGQPGLSDFGTAGRPGDAGEVGEEDLGVSIPWSPPEVLTGASNGSVASDVYSLGATIWHLLVGRAPFTVPGGDNGDRATFGRILRNKPPQTHRDEVPASLERLLQQTMAKDPALRPQSAMELARHFQRVEQELRLPRTEVVVLDQSQEKSSEPFEAAASASTSYNEPGAGVEEDDWTLAGRTTARPPDTRPLSEPETEMRPVRVEPDAFLKPLGGRSSRDAPPSPTSPRAGNGPASVATDAGSAPTEVRPRSTGTVQATRLPSKAGHQGGRWPGRGLLVAGLVGALAVVGVVAILLQGRHPSSRNLGDADQPTNTDASDAAPPAGVGPADPTSLRARVSGNTVIFSWAPVVGADAYSWTPDRGSGGTVTRPRVVVPRYGGSACVTVRSLQVGLPASPGVRRCFS